MSQVTIPDQTKSPRPGDDEILDIAALAAIIWRGKWWILVTTILAIFAAGYYAFSVAVPQFRSTSVVIFETQQESIIDLQSVVSGFSGDTSAINSEVEVLRSRGLMAKVVDRLDLASDPEFNVELRPRSFVSLAKEQVINLIVPGAAERPRTPPDLRQRQIDDAVISQLLEKTSVRNVPSSFVFQVTAQTADPEKSALIADTIVELYILNQIEVKFQATEQATSWLTTRVAELQVQLESAEARVSNFNATTDLVSIEALQGLERQLKDLRDRIADASTDKIAAEEALAQLLQASSPEEQVQAADDPALRRLFEQMEAGDPDAAALFAARFDQVTDRARIEVERRDQQLAALQGASPELESQLADQSQDLIALQQLQREAEASRLLYEYFLGRLKETSAQEGIQRADSRILSKAVVATKPASPRKTMILVVATVLGGLAGVGLVVLREGRHKGFRTARELEAYTGQTVVGQIPLMPTRNRKRILRYFADKPTSATVEAYRNLRTSLLLSNVDAPPKIIVSTSSIPGEGKTTNSIALAHNLHGLGKKVLLLEGDIRRRTLNQYFQKVPQAGLVSLLSGASRLEDVVFQDPLLGADIIAGDKTSVNAADLFSSDSFGRLISELRETYDAVIIDCPPVLVVPDARIIAQHADSVLFSVKWDSTSQAQVEESMRLFRDSKLKLTGLVLSQINPRGMKAYGYGGKYGAYSSYGSKYYTN